MTDVVDRGRDFIAEPPSAVKGRGQVAWALVRDLLAEIERLRTIVNKQKGKPELRTVQRALSKCRRTRDRLRVQVKTLWAESKKYRQAVIKLDGVAACAAKDCEHCVQAVLETREVVAAALEESDG